MMQNVFVRPAKTQRSVEEAVVPNSGRTLCRSYGVFCLVKHELIDAVVKNKSGQAPKKNRRSVDKG